MMNWSVIEWQIMNALIKLLLLEWPDLCLHCLVWSFSPDIKGIQCKLEDLKVLRRSPDLLTNVEIGQGQLQLIMKQILFYHILGLQPFWSSDLNNPMNTPSNSPVISEEKMFR